MLVKLNYAYHEAFMMKLCLKLDVGALEELTLVTEAIRIQNNVYIVFRHERQKRRPWKYTGCTHCTLDV